MQPQKVVLSWCNAVLSFDKNCMPPCDTQCDILLLGPSQNEGSASDSVVFELHSELGFCSFQPHDDPLQFKTPVTLVLEHHGTSCYHVCLALLHQATAVEISAEGHFWPPNSLPCSLLQKDWLRYHLSSCDTSQVHA